MRTIAVTLIACAIVLRAASAQPAAADAGARLAEARQAEAERMATIERVSAAVVCVFGAGADGGGSGVLLTPDGYALTNYHVVSGAGLALRCGLNDGRAYYAVLVGLDPTGDLALIKLLGRDDFPHVPWGDSDRLAQGDPVLVVGNPLVLADDFHPSVSWGILSGVGRYQFPAGTFLEYTDALQTDAAINPGNSGGPLFNAAGELIGINGRASFEKRGRVSVGVGYAISSNQARNFWHALRGGRLVDHASWGTIVASDGERGVAVSEILDDCDAARRGLKFGDVVLEFAGRRCSTPNELKNVLGIYPAGWRTRVVYQREDEPKAIEVVLDRLHAPKELTDEVAPLLGERRAPAPGGLQLPNPRAASELPEAIRAVSESKPGFVNYHFNRLERQRVWDAWQAAGGAAQAGPWELDLAAPHNRTLRFQLAGDKTTVRGAEAGVEIAPADWADRLQLAQKFAPLETETGLPAAALAQGLTLWQRLAARGVDSFGEVSYLGRIPPPGGSEPLDTLEALWDTVPFWFYFSHDGALTALEWAEEPAADRWQLRVAGNGREDAFPRELHFGRGGEVLAKIEVRSWRRAAEDAP